MLNIVKNLSLAKVDHKLQELSRSEKVLGVVSGVINANLWLQRNNEFLWSMMFSGLNVASASKLKDLHLEIYRLERSSEIYEDKVQALEAQVRELQKSLSSKASSPRIRARKKVLEDIVN